jgi:hypothetical protein
MSYNFLENDKNSYLMRIFHSVYEHVCSRKKIKFLWNLLKHISIENDNKTWNTIVVCQRRSCIGRDRQWKRAAVISTSIDSFASDITDAISSVL